LLQAAADTSLRRLEVKSCLDSGIRHHRGRVAGLKDSLSQIPNNPIGFAPVDTIPISLSLGSVYRGAMQRRGEKADVDAFTPHDFRRTFIGNLLDTGADIVTIAKLAGHASPSTTSKYNRRGEAANKRAIDSLHIPYSKRDKH
jgi:integrase